MERQEVAISLYLLIKFLGFSVEEIERLEEDYSEIIYDNLDIVLNSLGSCQKKS